MAATSTPRRGSRPRAFGLAALTLAVVAALDQGAKALALASLTPGESINVFYGIDLTLVRNTGIAFGALAGAGDAPIVAFTAVALGALLAFFVARADRPLLWLPVGVVLGGAAGNLIDRARFGAVVDFIDPVLWPAFNLADMAIVLGVLGLLYVAEGPPASTKHEPAPSADDDRRRRAGA
jgi:signal peptidase II